MHNWNDAEVAAELVTLQDFIRFGASQFGAAGLHFGHGTDNSVDEALHLVCHALHLPVSLPPEFLPARLTLAEKHAILELFSRRIEERRPAAYLTHSAWFAGLEFYVDERVLVPRSPIAELIEQGFRPWIAPEGIRRILDLGTGSGCIAIAAAVALPGTQVVATDISEDALAVAARNLADFQLEDSVTLLHSDLFDSVPAGHFDVIVSNPPYVSDALWEGLPAEYRHEPVIGLRSGALGLDHVARILADASRFLAHDGILVVEVGEAAGALEARFPELPFTWLEFTRGGQGVFLLRAADLEMTQ